MSSRHNFFTITSILLVLASMILSSCTPKQIEQPTILPNPTITATNTMMLFTETPDFSSGATEDAKLVLDRMNAIKATNTLISSLPNASQEEITKTLLIKWLEYYKTDQVDPYFRLKDYKIEEVSATSGYCPSPDKDTTKFAARVKFSIQTVTPHPGDWVSLPGDITLGNDNWINHLFPYVSISANKDTYTFGMEGSMPCG